MIAGSFGCHASRDLQSLVPDWHCRRVLFAPHWCTLLECMSTHCSWVPGSHCTDQLFENGSVFRSVFESRVVRAVTVCYYVVLRSGAWGNGVWILGEQVVVVKLLVDDHGAEGKASELCVFLHVLVFQYLESYFICVLINYQQISIWTFTKEI